MRIVLDTNVLLSGLFFGGVPLRVVEACLDGTVELMMTAAIWHEYRRAASELAETHPLPALARLLALVEGCANVVQPVVLRGQVCRDATDDKFIACALAAKAKYIVSGDKALLSVPPSVGVSVIRPRRFVDDHL